MLIKIDREGLRKALSPQQIRSDLRRAASLIIPKLDGACSSPSKVVTPLPFGDLASKCEGAGYFLPIVVSRTGRPLIL